MKLLTVQERYNNTNKSTAMMYGGSFLEDFIFQINTLCVHWFVFSVSSQGTRDFCFSRWSDQDVMTVWTAGEQRERVCAVVRELQQRAGVWVPRRARQPAARGRLRARRVPRPGGALDFFFLKYDIWDYSN